MKEKNKTNRPKTNDSNHYLVSVSLHLDRPETELLFTYRNLRDEPLSRIIREWVYEKMLSKEIEEELKELVYKQNIHLKRREEIRGFK